MGIWEYSESRSTELVSPFGDDLVPDRCIFCEVPLTHLAGRRFFGNAAAMLGGDYGSHGKELMVCNTCGWWIATHLSGYAYGSYEGSFSIHRACGSLKDLELADVSIPSSELCRYLSANYGDRSQIHPRKFEEVVASVFRGMG